MEPYIMKHSEYVEMEKEAEERGMDFDTYLKYIREQVAKIPYNPVRSERLAAFKVVKEYSRRIQRLEDKFQATSKDPDKQDLHFKYIEDETKLIYNIANLMVMGLKMYKDYDALQTIDDYDEFVKIAGKDFLE